MSCAYKNSFTSSLDKGPGNSNVLNGKSSNRPKPFDLIFGVDRCAITILPLYYLYFGEVDLNSDIIKRFILTLNY